MWLMPLWPVPVVVSSVLPWPPFLSKAALHLHSMKITSALSTLLHKSLCCGQQTIASLGNETCFPMMMKKRMKVVMLTATEMSACSLPPCTSCLSALGTCRCD
jgi:hypothetical protein